MPRACGDLAFMSGTIPHCSFSLFIEVVFRSNPELTDMVGLPSQLALGLPCRHLTLEIQAGSDAHLGFNWVLEIGTLALMFVRQMFTHRAISPAQNEMKDLPFC